MKIVSWNVRGAGREDIRNQLKILFHSHNPYIVILMETRINLKKAESIIASLNFSYYQIIPLEGFWAVFS